MKPIFAAFALALVTAFFVVGVAYTVIASYSRPAPQFVWRTYKPTTFEIDDRERELVCVGHPPELCP